MKINVEAVNIALARKRWERKDLAKKLNMSASALYHQLYKSKCPRTSTVGKIAAALGVDVTEIMAKEESAS